MAEPRQQSWIQKTLTGIATLVVCLCLLILLLPSLQPDKPGVDKPRASARIITTMDGDVFLFEEIDKADNPDGEYVVAIYAGKTADGTPLVRVASAAAMPAAPTFTCIYQPITANPMRVYEIDHTLLVWVWTPTGKCGGISYDALNFTADPHRYAFLRPVAARYLAHADPAWRITFAGFLARYHDPVATDVITRYARGTFTAAEHAAAEPGDLANARRYAEMLRASVR